MEVPFSAIDVMKSQGMPHPNGNARKQSSMNFEIYGIFIFVWLPWKGSAYKLKGFQTEFLSTLVIKRLFQL
jgi:hypothetical protein